MKYAINSVKAGLSYFYSQCQHRLLLNGCVNFVDLLLSERPFRAPIDYFVAVTLSPVLRVVEVIDQLDLLHKISAHTTHKIIEIIGREARTVVILNGGQPEAYVIGALGELADVLKKIKNSVRM